MENKSKGFLVICIGVVLILGGLALREAVAYRNVGVPSQYREYGGIGWWEYSSVSVPVKGAYENQAWVLIGLGVAMSLGGIYVGWIMPKK